MKVRWFPDANGKVAFSIEAETPEEEAVLTLFCNAHGGHGMEMTGSSIKSEHIGPYSFSFGVKKRENS